MSKNVIEAIRQAIEAGIPEAKVEVAVGAGPGHYNVDVVARAFAGKPMVQAHRMVYSAIAHLMEGDKPPVHAIDKLRALAP
jgi:stress-induced morphogen